MLIMDDHGRIARGEELGVDREGEGGQEDKKGKRGARHIRWDSVNALKIYNYKI
jgi:hypothetical protein